MKQHKIICLEGINDYSYCPAKTLNRVTEVSGGSVLLWVTVFISVDSGFYLCDYLPYNILHICFLSSCSIIHLFPSNAR